jgi:putative PIN family toxin of toxin-antitoxin system
MSARIVIDTNVYVSRALRQGSVPGMAVDKAWLEATTLFSDATWLELQAVLKRAKFARYIQAGTLGPYLVKVREHSSLISIPTPIRACRDPKDDKFLEVAVHGRADVIVTGDTDLLALNPFRGIAILTPAEYLERE